MSLPFSGPANGSFYKVNPSELNLITALGSAGSDVSDTFKINGGTVLGFFQLASGQTTISMKTDSATPISNPASGGDSTSVTLVGAGAKSFIKLDSSASNVYAAVKNVDANWSSALSVCEVWVVYQLSNSGFGWFNTDSAENGGGLLVTTLPQ